MSLPVFDDSQELVVYRKYLRADGTPDKGYVTFTPTATRTDSTLPSHGVTQSAVVGRIDATGYMQVKITSSFDPGWVIGNNGDPVPYRVEEHLTDYKRANNYIFKAPSPVDLGQVPPLDGSGGGSDESRFQEVLVQKTQPTGTWDIWGDISTVYPI